MRAAAPGNLDELHGTSLVCGARDTSKVCQQQGMGGAARPKSWDENMTEAHAGASTHIADRQGSTEVNLPLAKRD
jgi:hypothetical protein